MATAIQSQLTDEAREQRKREIRIAAKYRNDFGWRVLAEAIWGIGIWIAAIALAVLGLIPLWVGCLINSWVAYLMYMPMHEATHGNISGSHAKLRWIDDVVGSVSALPMWFSYRAHRLSHMRHHAYTNDPDRDPDFFLGGPYLQVVRRYLIFTYLQLAGPLLAIIPGGQRLVPTEALQIIQSIAGSEEEIRYLRRFQLAFLAVFALLSAFGFFWEALLLWYLPSRIGLLIVATVFAWLPHHPHNERGRYRDTRITLFPGGTLLIRGHNHHLLHHMFPRVPHYRLPALFREMRPILEEHGARIEGPLAGPDAPKITLSWHAAVNRDPSMLQRDELS